MLLVAVTTMTAVSMAVSLDHSDLTGRPHSWLHTGLHHHSWLHHGLLHAGLHHGLLHSWLHHWLLHAGLHHWLLHAWLHHWLLHTWLHHTRLLHAWLHHSWLLHARLHHARLHHGLLHSRLHHLLLLHHHLLLLHHHLLLLHLFRRHHTWLHLRLLLGGTVPVLVTSLTCCRSKRSFKVDLTRAFAAVSDLEPFIQSTVDT